MDWDERYRDTGYAYGTNPNEFLVAVAASIPPGAVLSLAEGEGRNAVYLAARGYRVTAVDSSRVGLGKAQALAAAHGVAITTIQADLASFTIDTTAWEGILACYCHLPAAIRAPLHRAAVAGLKPGGVFVLEAFGKGQLGRESGGPQSLDLLMSLDELGEELAGLELLHARETERELHEGRYHSGLATVVQILGRKP